MQSIQSHLLQASPDNGTGPQDARGQILSVTATARLLGLQRTQVWRYAKEGTLPAIVLGTTRHPQHYFERSDVLALKERRDASRAEAGKRRLRKAQPQLRQLLHLIETGELQLEDLPKLRATI